MAVTWNELLNVDNKRQGFFTVKQFRQNKNSGKLDLY